MKNCTCREVRRDNFGCFETTVIRYSHYLAAVNKLIKEAVPNVRVSVDARELLLRCSTGSLEHSLLNVRVPQYNGRYFQP